MTGQILLGTGILTWNGFERRSDRYGTVFLMADGETSMTDTVTPLLDQAIVKALDGLDGWLFAEVVEARQSTHIGDIFRGIFPSTPAVDDVIVLGQGTLFSAIIGDMLSVGLRPADGRNDDWLNPRTLYRAHEQLVRLWFSTEPTS